MMTVRQICLLILLSALWGGVFLLIKYALVDFSASEVAFLRSAIGALGLLAIVLVMKGDARDALGDVLRRPLPALLLGALAIGAPFLLIALGERTLPSGLAGVLASTSPIFIAVFAPFIDRSERISRRQGVGLILGLLGVALVVGAHFAGSLGQFPSALALLGAAVGGALSSFVVKIWYRDRKSIPASTTTFFALSVGALMTLPVAVVTAPRELPDARAVLVVLTLGLFFTAGTFMLYYSLINQVGEERATIAQYFAPAFALLYGALLLGESITVEGVIGLIMIIVGANVTLRGGSNRRSRSKRRVYLTH
jgi:drug/metabolite transporter (DMT)-like permease